MVTALLVLLLLATVVGIVARRDAWQRWWFELEDPRSVGLFRIVFAALVLCNMNGLREHAELLFDREGMFTGAEAGHLFAPAAFSADAAVPDQIATIIGQFSILYVFDGPIALRIHAVVFVVATVALMVGFRTRVAGVVAFLAMDGLLVRNFVFWEGTELVFRVFMAYLVCARSGHAYSIDAWLHRRRHPEERSLGPIPAWPRRLAIVQLSVLLGTAGLLKTGDAWIDGTAVHYALHSDAYARFAPIDLASLLRPVTCAARSAEALFPLVLVGLCARMPSTGEATSTRRTIARIAVLVLFLGSTLLVALTGEPRLLPVRSTAAAVVVWVAVFGAAWWTGGRARWLFGRRIWASAAAAVLLGMWALMNIGWFHPAVLACLLLLFDGGEISAVVDRARGRTQGLRASSSRPRSDAPLAYGPRVRAIMSALLGWHAFAIAVAALPASPDIEPLRGSLREIVAPWLQATRTVQYWGMWAPDPRLDNPDLHIVVVDAEGRREEVDLHGQPSQQPSKPSFTYDRAHKIASTIRKSGPDGPYQRALARWLCRRPSLQRGGRAPQRIELHESVTPISPPDSPELPTTRRELLVHPCEPRAGPR